MKLVFIKQLMALGTTFLSHTYHISKCRQPICHLLTAFQSADNLYVTYLLHFKVQTAYLSHTYRISKWTTYLSHITTFQSGQPIFHILTAFQRCWHLFTVIISVCGKSAISTGCRSSTPAGQEQLVVGFERSVSHTGSSQDEGGNRPVNSRSHHCFWKRMVMRDDDIQALFLSVVAWQLEGGREGRLQ